MNDIKLTLDQIYRIAEKCCTTDCALFRAGTCSMHGYDKLGCYRFQVARSECEDEYQEGMIFVLVKGDKVMGVYHSLQRAKRALDSEDLDGSCKIFEEKIEYGAMGALYHVLIRTYRYSGRWYC